ncbi:MAG: AAA family ATPase [Spirochaetaceae bacterium]|nr:AAA family ATPase [Spirochaetaceae bacterium]
MDLVRFQVTNYKVVSDSTPVVTDPRVTALVGKNESGKSAVLQALWKSRNVAGVEFDQLYDYPRGKNPHIDTDTQVITALEFSLSADEVAFLANELPRGFLRDPQVIVQKTAYDERKGATRTIEFDGEMGVAVGAEACQAIKDAVKNIGEQYDPDDFGLVRESAEEAINAIDAVAPIWSEDTISALDGIVDALKNWVSGDEYTPDNIDKYHQLEALLAEAKQGEPHVMAERWAKKNLPVFIYFDDYSTLSSRIHLPTYLESDGFDLKTRTQAALFDRSGIDPQEIFYLGRQRDQRETETDVHRRLEQRSHLLEKGSLRLTGEWVKWWVERQHVLHFEIDGEYIVLKVSDDKTQSRIPFEERSHGFQWFFSFYLVFLAESEKSHKGAILLLDEPGLHLHPTLQSKLLDLFELISESNQIVYSTHMPFLIDGEHLERVRTLYLTGDDNQAARISTDLRPEGDRDTLLPIQAALGYSIAQTLFIGKRSLIVEGITDYWIIKTLNECLSALNDDAVLGEDIVLIPAGGTTQLMPLASIMIGASGVGDRRLLVLLDSDDDGSRAADKMAETFGIESPVIMLGSALGLSEATIEDLVPRDDYASALKKAGYEFDIDETERKMATNVQAIKGAFDRVGLGKFAVAQRVAAAVQLVGAWGVDPFSVSIITRNRTKELFDMINQSFEKLVR